MTLRTRLLLAFVLLAGLALAGTGGTAALLFQVGTHLADPGAVDFARDAGLLLGLAAVITLVVFTFSSRLLHRDLLDRLLDMKLALEAIAAGDRMRRVPVRRLDEIGLLARELNAALDAREEDRGRDQGRLVRFRQMVLALVRELPSPAVAITLDGVLVASTLAEEDTCQILERGDELRQRGAEALGGAGPNPARAHLELEVGEGRVLALRPLMSASGRPVAWLGLVS